MIGVDIPNIEGNFHHVRVWHTQYWRQFSPCWSLTYPILKAIFTMLEFDIPNIAGNFHHVRVWHAQYCRQFSSCWSLIYPILKAIFTMSGFDIPNIEGNILHVRVWHTQYWRQFSLCQSSTYPILKAILGEIRENHCSHQTFRRWRHENVSWTTLTKKHSKVWRRFEVCKLFCWIYYVRVWHTWKYCRRYTEYFFSQKAHIKSIQHKYVFIYSLFSFRNQLKKLFIPNFQTFKGCFLSI